MKLTVCSKLCTECPFSKASPKGWLGFHTLDGVLKAQQEEGLFSCHLARKDEMTSDNIESGEIKICRGYIASATKSGIIFGQNHKNGQELKRLQVLITKESKEDENIILSRDEFKEHHGRQTVSPKRSLSQEEFLRRQGYRGPANKPM